MRLMIQVYLSALYWQPHKALSLQLCPCASADPTSGACLVSVTRQIAYRSRFSSHKHTEVLIADHRKRVEAETALW